VSGDLFQKKVFDNWCKQHSFLYSCAISEAAVAMETRAAAIMEISF